MAEPPSGTQQDPLDRIVVVLVQHDVDFIAIGGWAVQAQQYDLGRVTYDVDVTPEASRENLQRLSAALNELGAEVRHEDETLPFSHDGESLGRAAVWNLSCRHGDFDICLEPTGIDGGYDELVPQRTHRGHRSRRRDRSGSMRGPSRHRAVQTDR